VVPPSRVVRVGESYAATECHAISEEAEETGLHTDPSRAPATAGVRHVRSAAMILLPRSVGDPRRLCRKVSQ
jgi:hypothetical protein